MVMRRWCRRSHLVDLPQGTKSAVPKTKEQQIPKTTTYAPIDYTLKKTRVESNTSMSAVSDYTLKVLDPSFFLLKDLGTFSKCP